MLDLLIYVAPWLCNVQVVQKRTYVWYVSSDVSYIMKDNHIVIFLIRPYIVANLMHLVLSQGLYVHHYIWF